MTDSASSSISSTQSGVSDREQDWFQLYGIRHIAMIPDGNRRWAQTRSLPIEVGHAHGLLRVLPNLVHKLCDAGVHTLTVWGFSTENWTRERDEVQHLMRMCAEFLRRQLLDIAKRHDGRVCHLGRKDRLFPEVLDALAYATEATKNNESHVFNVALDYGGRDEIARAGEKLIAARAASTSDVELNLTDFLDTQGQPYPEPDIVIRTSGEYRMSGFLPMQTVYSELFFVDRMFPEMTIDCVREVAEQFRWRKRRFGA